jgi:hypothetical protein
MQPAMSIHAAHAESVALLPASALPWATTTPNFNSAVNHTGGGGGIGDDYGGLHVRMLIPHL